MDGKSHKWLVDWRPPSWKKSLKEGSKSIHFSSFLLWGDLPTSPPAYLMHENACTASQLLHAFTVIEKGKIAAKYIESVKAEVESRWARVMHGVKRYVRSRLLFGENIPHCFFPGFWCMKGGLWRKRRFSSSHQVFGRNGNALLRVKWNVSYQPKQILCSFLIGIWIDSREVCVWWKQQVDP